MKRQKHRLGCLNTEIESMDCRWFPLVVGVLLALGSALPVYADTSQANADGKAFADSLNNSKINDLGKNVDPSTMPNFQGTNVPETNYYGSGLNIENQAQTEALSNPAAQFINDARTNRPQITVDRDTDPLFLRHEEISTKAHGLSETYSGCVDLPVGTQDITKYEDKFCNVSGQQDTINFTCQKNLNVNCTNPNAGQPNPFTSADFTRSGAPGMGWGASGDIFWYGSKGNNRGGSCSFYENTITFYIADLNTVPEFVLQQVVYDDWLFVWVNNEVAFQGVGGTTYAGFGHGWKFTGNYSCEHKAIRTYNINVDAKPKLKVGWNTISIRNLVHKGGNAYLKFKARRVQGCTESSSYSHACPVGETHTKGTLTGSTCVGGPETRIINGVPIFRACWSWDDSYTRKSDPYFIKDAACGQLEAQGCGQTSAVCTSHNGVFCENQTVTYSCPFQTAARSVSMCGSQLVCPDGNCTSEFGQTYQPATEDFKKAATGLAVADEIAKQLDVDNLTIFTGSSKSCKKKTAGFSDCCKDSGWGTDIGLASCSNEEMELGLLKEASRVRYVGNYCSKDSFVGCITRKYVYCTYPSKLSRILVEQGKGQLGQGFGSAKNPDCAGFSLQELESLNFDAMDLTEFYSDVMDNAANGTTPNSGGVASDIQNKLKARYPQIDQGGN